MSPNPTNKKSLDVFSLCLVFTFATTGCGPSLDDLDALGLEPPTTDKPVDLGSPTGPTSSTNQMPGGAGNNNSTGATSAPKISVHVFQDAGTTCSGASHVDATSQPTQPTVVDAGVPQPTEMPPQPVPTTTPAAMPAIQAVQPRPGDLRITEIMVNPAGQDSGFEWFEILNTSEQTLDLTGLVVADNARESSVTITAISPGESMVFSQRLLAAGEGVVGSVTYGTAVSFNNDGDSLSLCIGSCASTTPLTRVAWGNLGARYDGHAVQFDAAGVPQCPAEPAIPTGGFGSPGQLNPSCSP